VQVVIVPIADRHLDYANDVRAKLEKRDVRVEVYGDNEPMRIKIAKAQQQKVPFMLIVGDREAEAGTVGVRDRTEGDIGSRTLDELVELVGRDDPRL
jgi:threonyl-tRNA synthetase